MGKKEKLANEYINLRKELDGNDFKPGLAENQVWYLVKVFKVYQLESKIEVVKNAIADKKHRLAIEAYYETAEGQAYKEDIEAKIEKCDQDYKSICNEFQDWIISEVNNTFPGGWTAKLSIGYKSGNVEIGLINRDPERKFDMHFGHSFTIYFDSYEFDKKAPRFELNYGTLGSFDLFNDETRPLYLNGLSKISNNKEWLHLLMTKFIHYIKEANKLSEYVHELNNKLKNPVNV